LKRELYGDLEAVEKRKKQQEFQNSLKAQLELKQKRLLEEKQKQEELRKIEEERIDRDLKQIEVRNSFMKLSTSNRAQTEYEHPFHIPDTTAVTNKSKIAKDENNQGRFNGPSSMQKSHFYSQNELNQVDKLILIEQKSSGNSSKALSRARDHPIRTWHFR
jgi:hypothetical protein